MIAVHLSLSLNLTFSTHPQSPPVIPEEVKQWQKGRAEFDRHWGQLLASIKGSAIDPLPIDCSLSPEEMLKSAVRQMEGVCVSIVVMCLCTCRIHVGSILISRLFLLLLLAN